MSDCCPCDDVKEPGLETVRSGLESLPRQVRGFAESRRDLEVFNVDPDQVIRLENDPLRPERGSLNIMTEGGA